MSNTKILFCSLKSLCHLKELSHKNPPANAGDPVSIPGLVETIPWKEEWQHTPALTLAWRIPWTEKPGGL